MIQSRKFLLILLIVSSLPLFVGEVCSQEWDELVGDLVNETWDELGDWNLTGVGTSEISPSGQLHQISDHLQNIARWKIFSDGFPEIYTFESRLNIGDFGSVDGYQHYTLRNGEYELSVRIHDDRVRIYNENNTMTTVNMTTNENEWYIWRFAVNNGSLNAYRNYLLFAQIRIASSNLSDGYVRTLTYRGEMEMHEDYIKIASGFYVPSEKKVGVGAGGEPPRPPWYHIPVLRLREFLKQKIGSPLWAMWFEYKVTLDGIVASGVVFVAGVVGFRILRIFHKPKKRKLRVKNVEVVY